MIKKKVPYALLTATALATLLSSTVFAAKGDFYYGDANNLTRVQKSEVKDKKDILKANKDKLYYQIDDTNIVKYSDYISKIVSGWATGSSIGTAVTAANADQTVRAGSDIVEKAAQVDNETETIVSSVSAINATTIQVVLKDKPAADLTVADASKFAVTVNGTAIAAPTAVTKVASDLTGKTYKLTIATLNGQQGDVAVNGTKAAVATGMVYGFDYKSPEVTSIAARGSRTLEVTFSEAIKDTTAISSNFKVTKVVGNSIVGIGTVALSGDGTKATITLDADLTIADYVLALGETATETATNRVKDIAGNSIYGGTEISFRPTADQLAVKEAPSITTVEYNNGTGVATVTFNKDVDAANIDVTKLTLGGIALTSSDVVAQAKNSNDITISNSVTITLSSDTKTAVNAATGALSFVGAEGAWTDGTTPTTGQTVAVTKVTPAVVSSASYNQETKVLTVNFDQPVKINSLAGIKINDADDTTNQATADGATTADGTALDTTTASSTWNLKLADAQVTALENAENDTTKLKVYLDADAVRNNSIKVISNVATTYAEGGVAVTYTADTTKPYVTGAEYDNRTNTLKLTFSEALKDDSVANVTAVNAVKVATAATGDVNGFDLSAETVSLDSTKKVLTITTLSDTSKIDNEYLTGKAIKVWLAKDVLVDKNGLKNDASTFDTGVTLTYHDYVAPGVGSVNAVNKTYIKVVFNEPVDKTTAETVSNYVIKDLAGNTLSVNSAVLQSDKKTVYLNTAAQESGKPYNLIVSNVRDLQQNLLESTTEGFYGNPTAATGKLGVSSTLIATAPINSKNDTLAIDFDAPVNQTQALNLANYVVLEATGDTDDAWADAKAVSLSGATATVNNPGTTVTIALGSYNLQAGKYYKVVVSNVTDVYGNALDSTKTTAKTAGALDADNLEVPEIAESNVKVGAVVLTFDQELNATEAAKVGNYKVGGIQPLKATYAWDAVKNKATVTLDRAIALTDIAAVQIKNTVTNLAGETISGAVYDENGFAEFTPGGSLGDNVAPTVDTVKANIISGVKDDTIIIKFKDSDILAASANNKANYVIKDGAGTVIPAADYTVSMANGTPDTVTILFNQQGDNAYNLQADGTYTVTITGIIDESGNAMDSVTKTAELVNNYSDGSTVTATLNDSPLVGTDNVFDIPADTTTLGNVELTFKNGEANVAIKKTSPSDFAIRVYDQNGQVTLSDSKVSAIKTLLLGQLDNADDNVLKANISTGYAQLKAAVNNLASTTVTSVQVDVFDLAGNKTTITLNLN